MAATQGQTQSLHTNALDEALALPTDFSARIARNTQIVLQQEAGATRIVDPWGGSYYVERLTYELAHKAWAHIEEVEALGGMLADISGPEAEKLIPRIEATVKDYNYSQTGDYRIWPGPNSNSFIAAILRTVPELGLALPPNAVGRDFRYGFYAGRTDSGTGFEINLHGLAGLKLGWVEGVEVNLLGLVAGLDWRHPGLKLPGFGRIGIDLPVTTALAR